MERTCEERHPHRLTLDSVTSRSGAGLDPLRSQCFNRLMGAPMNYGAAGLPEPQLVTVGDIAVSRHWVSTPTGARPIRGTVWTVTDKSQSSTAPSELRDLLFAGVDRLPERRGVVLAVLTFWYRLFGLLFLVVQERKMSGYIEVTVQGDGFHYSTMVPATSPDSIVAVHQLVNYARSLGTLA